MSTSNLSDILKRVYPKTTPVAWGQPIFRMVTRAEAAARREAWITGRAERKMKARWARAAGLTVAL